MLDEQRRIIDEAKALNPASVTQAAQARERRPFLGPTGRLMIVAADHSARGVLAAGDRPMAMANRAELLGALDDKVVLGSMNRGGLPGTAFEIDDRSTSPSAFCSTVPTVTMAER